MRAKSKQQKSKPKKRRDGTQPIGPFYFHHTYNFSEIKSWSFDDPRAWTEKRPSPSTIRWDKSKGGRTMHVVDMKNGDTERWLFDDLPDPQRLFGYVEQSDTYLMVDGYSNLGPDNE